MTFAVDEILLIAPTTVTRFLFYRLMPSRQPPMNFRRAIIFLTCNLVTGCLKLYSCITPLGLRSWPIIGAKMNEVRFLKALMLSVSG